MDFQQSDEGWSPFFRTALAASQPVVFHENDHDALGKLLQGLESPAFGDRVTSVVISPITPTVHEGKPTFLVIGLNPRTPYNEDYQRFIHVASRLIETALASVVLLEEEAAVRKKLAAELEVSRQEIKQREERFQTFAERATVGIFVLDSAGNYTYRNPAWNKIFQPASTDENVRIAWEKLVEPEDFRRCEEIFAQLYRDKKSVTFELRLKRSWSAPEEMQDPSLVSDSRAWILCSAYPELTETGEIDEIVGYVTDVSRQKFGEGLQKQRTAHALESKRRLENFIDTTSHEMRNPLTAIIQCADGIIQSHISLLQTPEDAVSVTLAHLETSLDAAQTIVQCAQHQKRIVDDILTMSKLDSDLLAITPVQMRPRELAARSVKMLESEARAADVDICFAVEDSYTDLGVDWVLLDPTRLLQVLINLITNAIKFTRLEDRREVVVSIGASLLEQPSSAQGVQYIRRAKGRSPPDQTPPPASEGEETLYVHFSVRDTGRGLSAEEKDLIFTRFSQASPKTHIHYGGSGLGLFISRRLVEMQGGAIGFASERKAGSTFSFYVKATRVAPEDVSPLTSTRARTMPAVDQYAAPPQGQLRRVQSAVHSPLTPPPLLTPEEPVDRTLNILIVEDNLVNQRVLAKQLTGYGCTVAVANHGAEALAYLQRTQYWAMSREGAQLVRLSVVLMDWEMPVMDGLTCVKRIREWQKEGTLSAHVPVIGVTANARPEQLDQAMDAGMVSLLGGMSRVRRADRSRRTTL
ncbi:MAG: response regulator [Terriglobus roseus]|nr:response regulator [Terriglobus roseus]